MGSACALHPIRASHTDEKSILYTTHSSPREQRSEGHVEIDVVNRWYLRSAEGRDLYLTTSCSRDEGLLQSNTNMHMSSQKQITINESKKHCHDTTLVWFSVVECSPVAYSRFTPVPVPNPRSTSEGKHPWNFKMGKSGIQKSPSLNCMEYSAMARSNSRQIVAETTS